MKKYFDTVLGSDGSPIVGATITVFNAGTVVKPSLYSDNGVTPLSNPTSTDVRGMFAFYVGDGLYDLKIEKSGYGEFTLTNVMVDEQDTAGAIAFTPTGGIAANTVAGALIELDGEISTLSEATSTALAGKAAADHAHDTDYAALSHAHDAGDISFTPAGGITADTVAGALGELDVEKLAAALLTGVVGFTGSITIPNAAGADLVLKWGTSGAIASGANEAITFAEAFPTDIAGVFPSFVNFGGDVPAGSVRGSQVRAASASGFTLRNISSDAAQFFWFAVGF